VSSDGVSGTGNAREKSNRKKGINEVRSDPPGKRGSGGNDHKNGLSYSGGAQKEGGCKVGGWQRLTTAQGR